MSFLLLLVVFRLILLLNATRAKNSWNFVKRVNISNNDLDSCEDACSSDNICAGWSLNIVNQTYQCYLESYQMHQLVHKVPDAFIRPPSIHGSKLFLNNNTNNNTTAHYTYKIDKLVHGPLAIDSTTVLSYPQHFIQNCPYTISMWVWLWRRRSPSSDEQILFTVREVSPRIGKLPAFLPSVVTNVRNCPNEFFVSGAYDRRGSYVGLCAGERRFHEWIHITITVQDGRMNIFINGKLQDYIKIETDKKFVCPYIQNVPMSRVHYTLQKVSNNSENSAFARRNRRKGKPGIRSHWRNNQGSPLKDSSNKAPKQWETSETEQIDPWDEYVNNTVIHVAGLRGGSRVSVGMVHQLTVLRNKALTQKDVLILMNHTAPPCLPTLRQLLKHYEVPILEGFTPVRWEGNLYLQRDWGLCPEAVCGPICVDDFFLLNSGIHLQHTGVSSTDTLSTSNLSQLLSTENKQSLSVLSRRSEEQKTLAPKMSILHLQREMLGAMMKGPSGVPENTTARDPSMALPDIGYPTPPGAVDPSLLAPMFESNPFLDLFYFFLDAFDYAYYSISNFGRSLFGFKTLEPPAVDPYLDDYADLYDDSTYYGYEYGDDDGFNEDDYGYVFSDDVLDQGYEDPYSDLPPVDRFGNPADDYGEPLNPFKNPVDGYGNPVNAFKRSKNKNGETEGASGDNSLGTYDDVYEDYEGESGIYGDLDYYYGYDDYGYDMPLNPEEEREYLEEIDKLLDDYEDYFDQLEQGYEERRKRLKVPKMPKKSNKKSSNSKNKGTENKNEKKMKFDETLTGKQKINPKKKESDEKKPSNNGFNSEKTDKKRKDFKGKVKIGGIEKTKINNKKSKTPKNTKPNQQKHKKPATKFDEWLEGHKDSNWYIRNLEGRVQGLYKLSMLWLNGRFEFSFDGTTKTEKKSSDNPTKKTAEASFDVPPEWLSAFAEPVDVWRRNLNEKTFSAMVLALWLADDLRSTAETKIDWSFECASMISQPLHLALAYRAGFDTQIDDYLPPDALNLIGISTSFAEKIGGTNISALLSDKPYDENLLISGEKDEDTVVNLDFSKQFIDVEMTGDVGDVTPPAGFGNDKLSDDDDDGDKSVVDRLSDQEVLTDIRKRDFYSLFFDLENNITNFNQNETNIGKSFNLTKALSENADLRLLFRVGITPEFLELLQQDYLKIIGLVSLVTDVSTGIQFRPWSKIQKIYQLLQKSSKNADNANKTPVDSVENLNKALSIPKEEEQRDFVEEFLELSLYQANSRSGQKDISSETFGANECQASAAYYFPVTQFVASHFGQIQSGVGVLEEVRLLITSGAPQGHRGEKDPQHLHAEATARDGDPNSQTSLGRKYYWGYGGVQRNEFKARYWFEQAAAQGDPEGLYNVGVMHANGQAGLPKDPVKAHQYFLRSAHSSKPFPLALQAVGSFYHYNKTHLNYLEAREYFARAAVLGSAEAHFSLAVMFREGKGGPVDIPRCVAHLAVATSRGHVRSLNFLAHALFDASSWLAQYGREQKERKRNNNILSTLSLDHNKQNLTDRIDGKTSFNQTIFPANGKETFNWTIHHYNQLNKNGSFKGSPKLYNSLDYDLTKPMKIYLSDGTIVALPHPVGAYDTACDAALPLMKYISEMSYRTKDVTKEALREYLVGNQWEALQLYEEAADLGVRSAQENAAYLYEKLIVSECGLYSDEEIKISLTSSTNGTEGLKEGNSKIVNGYLEGFEQDKVTVSGEEFCQNFLQQRATRRWMQLAQAGEPRAQRKVADSLRQEASAVSLQAVSSGVGTDDSIEKAEKNRKAAILYTLSAQQGDTESLLSLGWMLYHGTPGVKENKEAAMGLFQAAMRSEMGLKSKEEETNLSNFFGLSYLGFTSKNETKQNTNNTTNSTSHSLTKTDGKSLQNEDNKAINKDKKSTEPELKRWYNAAAPSLSSGGIAPALALIMAQIDLFLDHFELGFSMFDVLKWCDQRVKFLIRLWYRGAKMYKSFTSVRSGGAEEGIERGFSGLDWEVKLLGLLVLVFMFLGFLRFRNRERRVN